MNEETIVAVIYLISLFSVITFFVIRSIRLNKVKRISENIKYAKYINNKYLFRKFISKKRNINHRTRSYKSFVKTDGTDVVRYHIENNINNIRTDIETAKYNKNLYDEYLNEYNKIDKKTADELLNEQKISDKTFKKYERKLLKKYMKKNVYNIILHLKIYYQSPKGRNYYQKKGLYNFNGLMDNYNLWTQKKNYEISSKFERSIMSDSIRYDVLKRDNYRCCICGISSKEGAKLHIDHIIPVSKGGKTVMDNLQTLCERCNMGKSNKK